MADFQDGDVILIDLGDYSFVDIVGSSIYDGTLEQYVETGAARLLTVEELEDHMGATKAEIEELEDHWYWLRSLRDRVIEQNRREDEHSPDS